VKGKPVRFLDAEHPGIPKSALAVSTAVTTLDGSVKPRAAQRWSASSTGTETDSVDVVRDTTAVPMDGGASPDSMSDPLISMPRPTGAEYGKSNKCTETSGNDRHPTRASPARRWPFRGGAPAWLKRPSRGIHTRRRFWSLRALRKAPNGTCVSASAFADARRSRASPMRSPAERRVPKSAPKGCARGQRPDSKGGFAPSGRSSR
jgi:hypothetical protein